MTEKELHVRDRIVIRLDEVRLDAVRAQGPGGQNVNKVSSAIHLRFDVPSSSLPEHVKERLLKIKDRRITSDGVIVIKAQNHRTQEQNRAEALDRLCDLVRMAAQKQRRRIPTRPSRASRQKRLESKKKRGALKKLRSEDFT